MVEFLTVRPEAFAGIRDLYLRIGFEPTQACRDSGSGLTHALAKLHIAAATDAIVQRLHRWVEQRPLSMLRDQEIMDAISVLGDQPPEAQADLDAVERELAAAPWFFPETRGQVKVLLDRQRDFADRSRHLPLQNLTDAIERGNVTSVKSLLESGAGAANRSGGRRSKDGRAAPRERSRFARGSAASSCTLEFVTGGPGSGRA